VWTPKGYDWVYRRFLADGADGYQAIVAQPFENRFLLEKVPDFYKHLRDSYDENFYKQEVLGQYLNMTGGLVYSSFEREGHVASLSLEPHLPLLWALDFNVDPMSSVIAQIAGGKVRVLGEIVKRRATTRQACEEFLERFPDHTAGIVIYGDASGNQSQTTGASDYEMVREFFAIHTSVPVQYKVPKSNPSVRERINLTNSKLRNASGEIGLVVDSSCKELIKDFEQVCFKEDSNVIDKDRDRQRTHLSDALGYLLWQECRPLAPIGERPGRLF
jgi:hypothetical protein